MDSSSSSSYSRNKKEKLSVRKQTLFKKSSTSLLVRQETILRKACELSTLCDSQICVIHYDNLGNLVRTWPEDESQVQAMAARFSQLTDEEKQKKSTNLSKFMNKKMHDEKKRSLSDNNVRIKYSQKVQDLEGCLVNKLHLLRDMLREVQSNRLAAVTTVPDHQQQTESPTAAATNPLNHQSKYSIFLLNHENSTITQLPSHSSLEQSYYNNNLNDNRALLEAQGFNNVGYGNNNSVSSAGQVNFGYYNSLLGTQGFGGYDNTQGFNNVGYDNNNSVSSSAEQVNFGYYSSLLGTQGFRGYDNTQGFGGYDNTHGFNNVGYDNNNSVSSSAEQVNFGYYNSLLGTQGFGGYDNTQGFNNLCT